MILTRYSSASSSVALDFLVSNGLHDKAMSYYLDPTDPSHDPLDLQFVYGPSANYLATYASSYPQHFMSHPVKDRALERLRQALDLSPSKWAHAESPKHDLHILASLPRLALLPLDGPWDTSPLSMLPSKFTNPDVLDTLSTVFHGPPLQEDITFPQTQTPSPSTDRGSQAEKQIARMLYYLYLNYNTRLFEDLVKHADTVALESHALSAINLISAIATADWAPAPETTTGSLPSETDFLDMLPQPPTATPAAGALAILAPPALEHVLPYLLKPPQTFSNIVGGLGDTQNSAYKIATAKFAALQALCKRLEEYVTSEPGQGYEEIVETLKRRIAEGAWGRQGSVGTNVATMEL